MPMILSIRNVTKRYQNHLALNQISLDIPEGQIFGLLGPNGAGKTSLIRIINQITAPDEGEVFFNGVPLSQKHIEQIGYLPEERGLYKKMKVGEQLVYLARLKGLSKNDAMSQLKEWFIKLDIKDWWNKPVEDLSKGMQQKTQFISTVVHRPKLLILDEPFSGFDPINANMLKDEILQLKANGTSILFSTHRMESVEELCDGIALINHSEVVLQGDKNEIQNQFKKNAYQVVFSGELNEEASSFSVESVHENMAVIKLSEGSSTNQVLSELIKNVEVSSFQEIIPSFNDIFIQVVENKN
jgi:ABC-2 type transport system ATP-binding protein